MRQVSRIISTASTVWLLAFAGCAVGPDYQSPEMNLPESFHEAPSQVEELEDTELGWWKAFDDELLNRYIEQAVEANKDVRQALTRVNQSRALARQAFAELLPGFQAFGAYDKGKDSGARFPGGADDSQNREEPSFKYEVYTAGVEAAWEIDLFGRLRRDLQSRKASYAGSIAALEDMLRVVISEVANTYFQLRASQKQLMIAEKNIETQQETYEVAKAKFDLGEASELDLLRATAALEETKAQVPPYRLAVKTNSHRISVLLGKLPKELEGEIANAKGVPIFSGNLSIVAPRELLRRRPDVRFAERQLASETALIGMRAAELYPIVEVTGSVGVEAPTFSMLGDGAGTYRYGPRITWSPFDIGRLRSLVRQQEAVTEEALLQYEKVVLQSLEEAENALATLRAETERQANLKRAYSAAARAYEIARDQYREGVTPFLDVLSAQETMLRNESNLVESERALANAYVMVHKAFGGAWSDAELVVPAVS